MRGGLSLPTQNSVNFDAVTALGTAGTTTDGDCEKWRPGGRRGNGVVARITRALLTTLRLYVARSGPARVIWHISGIGRAHNPTSHVVRVVPPAR